LFLINQHPFFNDSKSRASHLRQGFSNRFIHAAQATFVALGAMCFTTANAASLGEAELRSWLGEPLSIRIPVVTTAIEAELLDSTCLKISADSEPYSLVRELRVELAASSAASERDRHFVLRGLAGVNEPYIKLVVRFACAGQGAISREFALLLDPRPGINAPTTERTDTVAATNKNVAPNPNAQRLSGQWVTPPSSDNSRADTLANIAEGVYPKSIKRKARYIAALRALNPTLAALNDTATLPPNMALTLPDLRTLSTTRKVVAATPARAPSSNTSSPQATVRKPQATPSKSTPAKQQSPKLTLQPTELSERTQPAQSAQSQIAKPARTSPATPTTFSLKLSGGEIDTSRSTNVTDEQRVILREKQFLLDADDQIAQFLSLKNAVKQLENRLNQVQSQLDVRPPDTTANTAPSTTADAVPKAAATQPQQPTQTTQAAPTKQPTWSSRISAGSIAAAFIVFAFIAATGVWLFRRRTKRAAEDEREITQLSAIESTKSDTQEQPASDTKLTNLSSAVSAETNAQNEADDVALAIRRNKGAIETSPPAPITKSAFDPSATLQLDAPDNDAPDNTSVDNQLDSDKSSNTNIDFLIGDDDVIDVSSGEKNETITLDTTSSKVEIDEARLRRLQYMQERYPELMSNTVSIDDADSVINTARHYLMESDAGAAKAIELLSYALEERPQEIHYWLALFETCRLKSMVDEYVEFANKFSILFAQSVEWRHIRQIGHKLAPTNALFQLPADAPQLAAFDSSVWLIVDPEKTKRADSLAVALRTQLFEESNTRHMQKESGNAK
jgi:hypothetical protein